MAERRKGRNSGNREGATHDDGGGLAAPHLVLALALALRANCPTLLLLVLRAGAAAAAHDESLNVVHELGLQIFERGPIRLLVFVELLRRIHTQTRGWMSAKRQCHGGCGYMRGGAVEGSGEGGGR